MYLSILAFHYLDQLCWSTWTKIGVQGAHIITTGCLISSALLSLVAFYEVGLCNHLYQLNYLVGLTLNSIS
jgi:NADH-ubiquinone oxidoreductase chain 5